MDQFLLACQCIRGSAIIYASLFRQKQAVKKQANKKITRKNKYIAKEINTIIPPW